MLEGVEVVADLEPVEYFHFIFDQHEVVYANGAETESLFPGPEVVKMIGSAAIEELLLLFPQLNEWSSRLRCLSVAGQVQSLCPVRQDACLTSGHRVFRLSFGVPACFGG